MILEVNTEWEFQIKILSVEFLNPSARWFYFLNVNSFIIISSIANKQIIHITILYNNACNCSMTYSTSFFFKAGAIIFLPPNFILLTSFTLCSTSTRIYSSSSSSFKNAYPTGRATRGYSFERISSSKIDRIFPESKRESNWWTSVKQFLHT